MSELPGIIGPYQVLRRLGAGGMGEVFLAHDERLDRQVAIKRVRADKDLTPQRRERFLREARIAARLNHPAIVQIYDVLHDGDLSYIVLEYVEGTSLRRLLDEGPLAVEEAMVIARDIAAGLAEADRQGIVHRDLKTENVLVTPAGRAKIADFGIAKCLLGARMESSLTREGHVMGTWRAMSPEQARGEELDHRSDLFSFGVLLYEMLAGQSPFEAENGLATLNRILHDRQAPVRSVNPAVPENLSDLVDRLLQKDPLLRPRTASELAQEFQISAASTLEAGTTIVAVPLAPMRPAPDRSGARRLSAEIFGTRSRAQSWSVIGLLLAVLLGGAAYLGIRQPRDPVYVAVMPPEVSPAHGLPEADLLGSAVYSALVRGLISLEGISPKSAAELQGISGSPAEVARAVDANEVVRSRLACRPQGCRIVLEILRGKDGSLLGSVGFDVPTDDLFLVSRAVENQLRQAYSRYHPRSGFAPLDVSGADLKEFLRLRQRFDLRQDASDQPMLDQLAALRDRSPRFLEAYLLSAEILRDRFGRSRNPQDLEKALTLIRQAQDLAPGDPQPLFSLFSVALDAGRLATAESALARLESLLPGDARVLERRAQLLDARGRPKEALSLLRSAVAGHPSWGRLYRLALMETAQGEIADARLHLNQLLVRSPGNYYGLSLLAQIELAHGDAARAAGLYQELLRRSPKPTEFSNLGFAYLLLGRYPEAAEAFRQATVREPGNPLYALNLADARALQGRGAESAALYRKVLGLLATAPAASNAQTLTVKAQALAHLGDGTGAVAAVQEALRLAPADAQRAYEAALVFSLLGERNSALVNAEQALRLGCEPRFFRLPWFRPLQGVPSFEAALRPRS